MKQSFLIIILLFFGFIGYSQTQNTSIDSVNNVNDLEKIFPPYEVDSIAKYPDGEAELYRFFAKNIQYPKAAIKKNIRGKVYASWVVEKDGSISNPAILRGLEKSCDKEVLRLISLLPNGWTPAYKDGKAVRLQFIFPVKFAGAFRVN